MNNTGKRKIPLMDVTGTVESKIVKQLVLTSPGENIRAAVHSKNRAKEIRQYKKRVVEIVELDVRLSSQLVNEIRKSFLYRIDSAYSQLGFA
jgi:hypothetical protein